MDNQVFYTVVVPTLITGAAFIGITTLGEDSNFVDTLISIQRNDGKPLIHSIQVDMVCDNCKREGKELTCQHKNGDMPHWQSQGRAADIELMMAGQEATHLLETKGIRGDGQFIKFFDESALKRMEDPNNIYRARSNPSEIYISIDPSAGGKHSEYAITSCIYDESKMVVVGAESGDRLNTDQIIRLIVNHIHKLRTIGSFKDSHIIIVPECNLGNEAGWIESGLKRTRGLYNWTLVHEDRNKRAGFRTNNETKCMMAYDFSYMLHDNNVAFHQDFVCIGDGKIKNQELVKIKMKRSIMDQLRNYSRSVKTPHNSSGRSYEIFSGKMGLGKDDHAIAIQLNLIVRKLMVVNRNSR